MTQLPDKVSLLITNGFLITMDPSRRMIRDGVVAIRKDRIVWVGKERDLEHRFEAETMIDAKGYLVLTRLKRIDASAESLKRRARIHVPWKWPVE